MTDERIDIHITDKVSPDVRKKILQIADASIRAHNAVSKLKSQLDSINVTALSKLSTASAKVTNALARETNATARLTTANGRMQDSNNKAAISQQRLATETAKTTALQEKAAQAAALAASKLQSDMKQTEIRQQRLASEVQRTTVARNNANAASKRAELAALRLKTAQDKLNASTERSNHNLGTFIRTAATFAGVGFGGAAIIRTADAYTILENKLRNVADSERQLVEVSREVFEVANRTRAPVQDTAQAFQRFDLALKQLGASQRESLQLTETVNKSLVLSGSTTNEQASALLQLSQAFNKGKLDGDEFRTVMELMPQVADAIAKELNVTRGELLKLSPQGKITAEVMRSAFANARQEISEKFAKTIPTLGQAFVVLRNKATQFFGELNKRFGITEALAKGLLGLADNMHLVGIGIGIVSAALLVAFGPAMLGAIAAATTAVKAFTLAIAANPIGLLIVGVTTAIALFSTFKDEIKIGESGIVSLGDTVTAVFQIISETVEPVARFFRDVWDSAFNDVENRAGGFVGILGGALSNALKLAKVIVNGYIALFAGAYNAIVNGWKLFPGALKDILIMGMNFAISVVERGINGVLNRLKAFLQLANDASEFLGLNPIFNTNFDVDLSAFKGELSGAASELGNVFSTEFSKAFNTDFVGDAVSAVSKRALSIANERIANQKNGSSLRGEGKDTGKKLSEEELKALEKRATALGRINRELDSELSLLSLIGPEREVQQQLDQITNTLLNKKISLTKTESESIKEKLVTLQKEKGIQQELDSIYESSIGKFAQLADGIEASNRAYERGIINAETYANKLVELNAQAANLRLTMGDGTWSDVFTSSMAKVVESYQGSLPAMAEAFGNLFTQLTDGFANSIGRAIVYGEELGDTLRNVARSAISELISSIIKMGIQWLIQTALQKTAATTALATQTAASVAAASTTAAAWASPAALVSLASFGANSVPASAGIAATTALAQALAAAPGFEEGGYTGNAGRKEIAGVVHGREFVMDAASTQRIGVGSLEALRSGAASVQQGQRGGQSTGGGPSSNQGQGQGQGQASAPSVTMKTINLLDSSMLGDYLDSSDSDEVFINKISRNSEQIRRYING